MIVIISVRVKTIFN